MNTFPAVHLKKMDSWDYMWHFSSELVVVILVLIVAFFNFRGINGTDKSLAADFISLHVNLNPKLYAHNTATKTVIKESRGLITEASADTNVPVPDLSSPESPNQNDIIITDTGLEAPIPDSVRNLLKKQINKVYTTQSGDTLGSIAKQYNVSIDTIIMANNLPGIAIKPGWHLLIPPEDGLIIHIGANTTIPDLAKKYKCSEERIISYNGLENAEDIAQGDVLFGPGCSVPRQAQSKPKPKTPSSQRQIGINDDDGPTFGGGHIFPKGYCTWYVAQHIKITFGGNAKAWPANARAAGYVVNSEPMLGGVVVTNDNKRYGHVALVIAVTDNAIKVREMNYIGFNIVGERWIPRSSKSIKAYIHE